LGGGASSLAAVYALTSRPGWQEHFDITVYQLGWRLGGKCATGRDAQVGQRIYEHGLHVWFGFYENAFRMMRGVYRELDRSSDSPLASWEQAFKPHNQFAMQQQFNNQWYTWNLQLPVNPSTPGDGLPFPPPWDVLIDAIEVLYEIWNSYHPSVVSSTATQAIDSLMKAIQWPSGQLALGAALTGLINVGGIESAHAALFAAKKLAELGRKLDPVLITGGHGHPILVRLLQLALKLIRDFLGNAIYNDLLAYRTWLGIDAIGTGIIGFLADDLLTRGLDSINDRNFKDWVQQHGGSPELLDSCLIQAAYDSSFALFKKADNPDFEAGTVLRGAMRMFLMFKGSVVYRFAAGTGDTVFAPLYQVLKRRGVRFEFFHEVTELVTPPSGPMEVTEVKLNRQVDLNVAEYDPLVMVQGLPCWPSTPRYDQLVQGAALRASGDNLESHWTPWVPVGQRTLKKGVDFDDVICGLSFEPLKLIAPTLAARHAPLQQMLDKLQTTRTQAFQLWTLPDLAGLGWTLGSVLLSTFGEPLDTWGDLSLVLGSENWPASQRPKCVGYFCGAMTEGDNSIPPKSHHAFAQQQADQAKADALDFIQNKLWALWPAFFDNSGGTHKPRWDLLADVSGSVGPARFDQQFWRANADPSERYVLSLTNTSRYRLRSDRTGFSNLYLVGDYTSCGINAGSMEAAIISGLQASRALCGHPQEIPGEGSGLI
jgi:uncharacterized protein with NAD-binding domain and iron-sulfur cluster